MLLDWTDYEAGVLPALLMYKWCFRQTMGSDDVSSKKGIREPEGAADEVIVGMSGDSSCDPKQRPGRG